MRGVNRKLINIKKDMKKSNVSLSLLINRTCPKKFVGLKWKQNFDLEKLLCRSVRSRIKWQVLSLFNICKIKRKQSRYIPRV